MTTTEHYNAARLRRGYEAIEQKNLETLTELIAEDARWHVAGGSTVAGTHEGRDAIFTMFMKILQATEGTMAHQLLGVLADDENGVAVYRATARSPRGHYDQVDVTRYRFEDGRVVEAWEHPFDQSRFDAQIG